MHNLRRPLAAVVTAGLLLSAPWVLPEGLRAGKLLQPDVSMDAIADYRLGLLSSATYQARIESALAVEDADLAESLMVLADTHQIAVPLELRNRVIKAQEFDAGRALREGWKGMKNGDATSPEALTGAVAADLTGIGDARDLLREGTAYLSSQPYDPLVLGLSVAGLAVTGVTLVSLGGATPARVGVTALKIANKAGEIPPRLRREIIKLARDAIDGPALEKSLALFKRGEFTAGRDALTTSIRVVPLQSLKSTAMDFGTVVSTRGYRAGRDVLKLAEHPRDVAKLRGFATRIGKGFRGTLALLGPAVFTLAGLAFTLTSWLLTALLWCLAALYILYRLFRFAWRVTKRRTIVS